MGGLKSSLTCPCKRLGRPPEALNQSDLEDAALVIAMSRQEHYPLMREMFPAYADQITYWDVEDTGRMSPDLALQRIELLVDRLIGGAQLS